MGLSIVAVVQRNVVVFHVTQFQPDPNSLAQRAQSLTLTCSLPC